MNQVETLIEQYCPNGVEYHQLKDVLKICNGKDYKHLKEGNIPVYGSGGVMTHVDTPAFNKPSVLIPRKGSLEKLYYVDIPFWTVDTCFYTEIDTSFSLPKFLFYVLQTKHLERLGTGGGVPGLTQKTLYTVEVPTPPIPVQEKIVEILDSFTALEAELEAELEARTKQYEFYRDSLLTLDSKTGFAQIDALIEKYCPSGVRELPLEAISILTRGRVISKDYLRDHQGNYPVYSSQTQNNGVFGKIDTYFCEDESITWTTDGANAGSVFYHNNEKFSITNVCGLITVRDKQEANTRFLYYYLSKEAKKHVSSGMGNPKLMSNVMGQIPVRLPPLPIQEQIVDMLDKFSALTTDITQGLPAEIAMRKKQYEYYRDKLLTFRPLEA